MSRYGTIKYKNMYVQAGQIVFRPMGRWLFKYCLLGCLLDPDSCQCISCFAVVFGISADPENFRAMSWKGILTQRMPRCRSQSNVIFFIWLLVISERHALASFAYFAVSIKQTLPIERATNFQQYQRFSKSRSTDIQQIIEVSSAINWTSSAKESVETFAAAVIEALQKEGHDYKSLPENRFAKAQTFLFGVVKPLRLMLDYCCLQHVFCFK